MAETIEFNGELREQVGKAAARRFRRLDKVPATVYGAGKEPKAITLPQKDVLKALNHEATFSHILTLKIGEKKEKVILKALQRHATKPLIIHMDFQRIKASEKIHMTIPIHFLGEEECPGTKDEGILSRLMTEVDIRCLPANLPEYIEVDVSKLELDESLHLSDLKLPQGVELDILELNDETDLPIVSVHLPKVSKEDLEAEAAEAALAAEASAEAAEEAEAEEVKEVKEEGAAEEGEEKTEGETADKSEKTEDKPKE